MFVFPQNSHAEILMPTAVLLGYGAFGSCLGHEDGALMKGMCILIREALVPFCQVRKDSQSSVEHKVGPRQTPDLPVP